MYEDCPNCKLLWDEFAEATRAHVAILGKTQLAQIQQNHAVLIKLEPLKAAAAERRAKARTAFQEHATIHEKGNATAQTA